MSNTKAYPPSLPLDMAQFSTVTGGKSTYQEELLELFFLNTTECMVVIERNCTQPTSEKWREAISELKNISSSIGALELSKVCAASEKLTTVSEEEKHKILASLRTHVQRLRAFVRNTRY